jgi:hypothetical protein
LAAFYSDRLVEGTLDWTTATLAKWIEIFFEAKLFQVALYFTFIIVIFFIGCNQAGQFWLWNT